MFLVWRVWRTEEVQLPRQRDLQDVQLQWRCANGHVFDAPGQMDPYPCPQCGAPAEAIDIYVCPQHGQIEVQVRFEPDPDTGKPVAATIRVGKGLWVPVGDGVRCPRCREPMRRQGLDYRKNPHHP
jgi:hypothetical protein